MTQKKYDDFDVDIIQRMTAVETKIQVVDEKLDEMRDHNDKRIDELLVVLNKQGLAEKVLFGVGGFIKDNWKSVIGVALFVAGYAGIEVFKFFQ